jgi:hypothetical protein
MKAIADARSDRSFWNEIGPRTGIARKYHARALAFLVAFNLLALVGVFILAAR